MAQNNRKKIKLRATPVYWYQLLHVLIWSATIGAIILFGYMTDPSLTARENGVCQGLLSFFMFLAGITVSAMTEIQFRD